MPKSLPYNGSNRLLASLDDADFTRLAPSFERVSLTMRQPLEVADEIPSHLYFPEGSIASVVATLRSGKNFEVGFIGWEGMTGTSILVGAPSPFDAYVQFVGPALRLPANALIPALRESETLHAALGLYAHSVQTAYTALAGAHAPIVERLARWLLMVHDRVEGDHFPITHEFLSIMLGVRRPGITVALQILEGEHLIQSKRGTVSILDRDALLARAGNAYGKSERSYSELIKMIDPGMLALKLA